MRATVARFIGIVLAAAAVGVAGFGVEALSPSRALADGDPASDMLIGQSVFYPFSRPVTAGLQKTLNAEAATAGRAHFPIKVALIDTPEDLGAIQSLFGKPQQYASFLDQEISFQGTTDPLLVVMPNGYGVAGLSPAATSAAGSLPKPAGRQIDDLALAAITAVRKLAAASGHPFGAISSASGTGAASSAITLLVLAAVASATAAAVLTIRNRQAITTEGLAFTPRDSFPIASKPRLLIGAALIAGGLGWALARGLTFYGLTLANIGYDLDQPPVLLVLVGGWLLYRRRHR